MSAGSYNFTVEQGATYDETFTWNDSTGSPVNLTGYTAKMQIRVAAASSSPLLYELNTSPGVGQGTITLGGIAGTIRLQIPDTDSAGWTWSASPGGSATALYDLKLTSGSSKVTRLLKGTITLDPEVTY